MGKKTGQAEDAAIAETSILKELQGQSWMVSDHHYHPLMRLTLLPAPAPRAAP